MTEAAATVPPMPLARTVRAYLSDAAFESLRLFRTPAFSIPILAMPLIFYSFFGVVLNGRAAHAPQALDLPAQPGARLGVGADVVPQDLQGDRPPRRVQGQMDDAHPALADPLHGAVRGDHCGLARKAGAKGGHRSSR